jgi:hypothetical protein
MTHLKNKVSHEELLRVARTDPRQVSIFGPGHEQELQCKGTSSTDIPSPDPHHSIASVTNERNRP